jgi:hypothetical protein
MLLLTAKPGSVANSSTCTRFKMHLSNILAGRLSVCEHFAMEDAVYLALSKGLNYAVTLAILPIEDISRVEQVIGALPEEAPEEVWQETVRILKCSRKARDTGVGKKSL